MAPTPTIDIEPDLASSHGLPPLHLRCLDLAHKGPVLSPLSCPARLELTIHIHTGSDVFFQHTSSPQAVLSLAASHVLRLLYPSNSPSSSSSSSFPCPPPPVRSITLHLHTFDGVAYTCRSDLDNDHKELHLSLSYLEGVAARAHGDGERVRHEIEGVLTHELVHAFQYDGQGTVPGGVIEGVADWLRGEAGLAPPHWRDEPGEDDKWDAGYERTVRPCPPLWVFAPPLRADPSLEPLAGLLPRLPLAPLLEPAPRPAAQRRPATLDLGRRRAPAHAPRRQGRRRALGGVQEERRQEGR